MDALWKICPGCKTLCDENICVNCGRSLLGVAATELPPPPGITPTAGALPDVRQKRVRRRHRAWIAAVCAAVLLAFAAVFILTGSRSENLQDAVSVKRSADALLAKGRFAGLESGEVTERDGEFSYYITDGEAVYLNYLGTNSDVVIPDELDGFPVTAIGGYAFFMNTDIRRVTVPDSVTVIGDVAFGYASELEEINLPDGTAYIGARAFSGCVKLGRVEIPDKVAYIGHSAFDGTPFYESLTGEDCVVGDGVLIKYGTREADVVIPDGVKVIAGGVFQLRPELESVVIPDGVLIIGAGAFYQSKNLTDITIPESVRIFEYFAFDDTAWFDSQASDFIIVNDVLIHCGQDAEEIIVPQVKSVASFAFFGCQQVRSVYFQNGTASVETCAFYWNTNLEQVTFPQSVTWIADGAFSDCSSLRALYFEGGAPVMTRFAVIDVDEAGTPMPVIFRKKDARGWYDPWHGYDTEIWD